MEPKFFKYSFYLFSRPVFKKKMKKKKKKNEEKGLGKKKNWAPGTAQNKQTKNTNPSVFFVNSNFGKKPNWEMGNKKK